MAAKKVVSGKFGGKGTATWKDWDAMHTFSTRKVDGFGGKVHSGAGYAGNTVPKAMQEFYRTEKLNPCITSIKITVDPVAWTVEWEVTIEESPDGKAYVGFNSWGGAAGGYPAKSPPGSWAYSNYLKEVKSVVGRYPGADPRNVIDFYFPGGFRQIFFQYTIPKDFPNLPKSANARKGSVGVDIGPSGSPKNLPEYNGVLFPTVKYTDPEPAENAKPEDSTIVDNQKADEEAQIPPPPPVPPDPRYLSGKMALKVKSGPGDIVGLTEVEIVEGVANFSGIQFNAPGDYVISVSSTSPDIDSAATEIKIKVNPEPEAIPQEPKGNTASEDTGTRPIIAQIDQPSPEVNEMRMSRRGASDNDANLVASGIGKTPYISYNGIQINDRDIDAMTLYHDGLVPKLDITFRDTNGIMSKHPPRDDTKFEIYLESRAAVLKFIHLRMKIEDYKNLSGNKYQFFGTLDITNLYKMKFKVYRSTSFEALRSICKELGLGFNSNIENTKDEMPWRNIGDKQFKFMEDIIKHSYISDTSFMAGYIDYYYCFNYVDVEKEMNRDVSKDMGIDTGGFDTNDKSSDKLVPLILTTEKGTQTSNMQFVKIGQKNESTKTSIQQGYKTRTKFYDKVKKMFLVFDVDSTTSDGSKSLILKGEPQDQESFENNYVTKYEGKIDTDNAHKNYNYAVTQNRINLDNMVKNQMEILLPNPNFNLYKYQKIRAFIIKEVSIGSSENVEWRWSGEWLISDIRFTFIGGKFEQKVTLVRKEMGKNPEEIAKDDNAAKKETKEEKNENPIVGSQSTAIAKPNETYKPGEEYTVEDLDGRRYVVKISSLAENGNEVKAEIRDIDYVYPAVITNPDSISGMSASSAGTSGTSGTAGTSGTTASVGPSYYPYEVNLRKVDYTYGSEMPQSFVTAKANSYWKYIIAAGSYRNPLQHLSSYESREVYIAIKRPIPDFKPQKEEKDETPYSWVLFELKDLGVIEPGTDSYDKLKDTTIEKYEVSRSRLLDSNDRGIEDWRVSKGYVKVLDSTGKEVWSSENDSVMETTGEYDIASGRPYGIGDSKYDYQWFKSKDDNTDQDIIPKDQLYTYVGGPNIIFIDMSNPAKFPAGTYTLELKYNVPLYEKLNSGGENDGKPYDGKGAFYTRTERLRSPKDESGNSPCEAKILRETFTISRRSQRR